MAQDDKVWWYAKGDQKFGPYSSPQLKALATKGSIELADLIWKEGLANWLPASSVKGLIPAAVPAAPPPLPAGQKNVAPTVRAAATVSISQPSMVDTTKQSMSLSQDIQMDQTAKFLKFLIITIFALILSALFLPKDVTRLLMLLCFPVMAFCSFSLAKSLNMNSWLWGVLVLIPAVNLGALFVLIKKSTTALKAAGYTIGLLGGTKPR